MTRARQQRVWCNLKKVCASLALCSVLLPSCAYAATLTNVAELTANSNLATIDASGDTYQLKTGTHDILSTNTLIRINHMSTRNIQMIAGTTFTLGDALGAQTDYLLMVNKVNMLDGTLNAYGGATVAGERNNGLFVVTLFSQAGGTINAYGGSGNYAYGIGGANSSFIQTGGILNVYGGIGNNAYGLGMINATGTRTQSGGIINAYGGSGNNAHGFRMAAFNQSGGHIMALGGSGVSANGAWIGTFNQNETATLTATGGSGSLAHGLHVQNAFIQDGAASLTATGGSANAVFGMNVVGTAEQRGSGTLTFNGGTATSSHGFYGAGNFLQSGTGLITANGGTAATARGMHVVGTFTQKNGFTVAESNDATGIFASQFIQDGGEFTAKGKAGNTVNDVFGIETRSFTQNGGTIHATGGDGQSNHGITVTDATGDFTQNGTGNIVAQGGSGLNSAGIRVNRHFTQNGAGTVSATAGSGANAHGIDVVQNFTQSGGGSITATGSATGTGNGLNTLLDITQSAGTMNFTGGGGATAYGAYTAQDFIQSGAGTVFAQAGSGANAYGLRVDRHFTQTGGSFTATASDAVNGYGAYVHETATIDGTLTVTPNMGGGVHNPALYVQNNSAAAIGINYGANSMLHLDLDGNTQRSGLVRINQGNTTITAGARVDIGFIHNMHNIPFDQPVSMLFLENVAPGATISNAFQFLNTHPTLNWNITQAGNDYYVTITRIGNAIDVIHAGLPVNASNLIHAFPALTGLNTPESAPLRMYADLFENSRNAEEAKRNARFLQHNLTPHTFTRVPRLVAQNTALIRSSMHNRLNNLQQGSMPLPGASQESTYAGNHFAPSSVANSINHRDAAFYKEQHALGWQVWTDSYSQFGSIQSRTPEYLDAKQQTMGMGIGARRVFESGHSLAIAGHYLNTALDTEAGFGGGKTAIRTQSTGVSAGLRMLLPEFDLGQHAVAPRLELMTTYSALDIDQERYVFANRLDSNTNGNLYQGHAMLYTPFMVSEKTLLTPEIGMTYTLVDIDDFQEENHNNLGLHTSTQKYNSLLVHLGLSAETALGSSSSVYGGITLSKDILEDQVKLNNRFRSVPQVAFQTVGEKDTGISAHMRTGMNIDVWETLSVNPEYTFGVSQGHQTHSFGLNLSVSF